jgi:hypothetical protein
VLPEQYAGDDAAEDKHGRAEAIQSGMETRRAAEERVNRDSTGTGGEEKQEDDKKEHGDFATVSQWPETARRMRDEIDHQHLASQYESDRPSEEPQQKQDCAQDFEGTGKPVGGEEGFRGALKQPKDSLQTEEQQIETSDDAKQAQYVRGQALQEIRH